MPITPDKTALLFPGQGSQTTGMGRDLAAAFPTAAKVFQQADQILGFSLSKLAWKGPDDVLNDTVNTQPALFVHSAAALAVFNEFFPEFRPAFMAGHSMGELSALMAAGSLTFEDGLKLVRARGQFMKEAGVVSPGGMAAIIGLEITDLERICAEASRPEQGEIVQVANDNCPGQVVISGSKAAVDRALQLSQQAGARRTVPLAVSIPAHSPLMMHAQAGFNRAVAEAPISEPVVPLVGNVTASPLASVADIRADLQNQLTHRVRWTESILFLIAQGITTFIELGSGTVLTGLLKRIDRSAVGLQAGTPADFDRLKQLIEC
jgi:[acyl-carrier-protein] S-malonyltransferase